jgi:PEP-CTERM motif
MNYTLKSASTLAATIITFGSLAGGANAAVTIPVGVQQNIPISTVTATWGWSLVYQGTYDQTVSITTLFAGVQPGDYIMYAARPVGSLILTLLAAADEADVRTVTAQHQTTASNGAEWYYNGGSIGFTAAGQTIYQNSADVNSSGQFGGTTDAFGATRLSWHGSSTTYGVAPTSLVGGWRAGETVLLNSSVAWERLVFVGTPVPEPSSAILIGLGSLGIVARRRRN